MIETTWALRDRQISCLRITEEEIPGYLGKDNNVVFSVIIEETIEDKKVTSKAYYVFQEGDIKKNAVINIGLIEFN